MAHQSSQDVPTAGQPLNPGTQRLALASMLSLYFLFGFVTVLNDILIPHLKAVFNLTIAQATWVQSAFFGAYFIMGYPAAQWLKKMGYKGAIVSALVLVAVGLLAFYPASAAVSYPMFLMALFTIGTGFTVLQVAANPYVSLLGAPEAAASRLNAAGFLNSTATTFGPLIGAALILIDGNVGAAERAAAVQVPYLALAGFVVLLASCIAMVPLPAIVPKATEVGNKARSAFSFPHLRHGMAAIFTYVGVEVGVGSVVIFFVNQKLGISEKEAAFYVSLYWGGLWLGRTLGVVLMRSISMQKALLGVTVLAAVATVLAMVGNGYMAVYALLATGLAHSIMWPCIFPLAIKDLGPATEQGSGLLVSMIVGGAIVPPVMGIVAEAAGMEASFLVLLLGYAYLLWYSLKGYKEGLAA